MANDRIDDMSRLVIHQSPDVRTWPQTVNIIAIRETSRAGFALTFDRSIPESWKWPSNPAVPSDHFLYTVWFCARLSGVWHGAGLVQMWEGRPFTRAIPPLFPDVDGAPGFTRLWGDARRLWGELSNYVPVPGDMLGIMVSAGNARLTDSVSSVPERSNLVLFPITASDEAAVVYPPPDMPGPVPVPVPPGPPPGPPPVAVPTAQALDLVRLEAKIDEQTALIVRLYGAVNELAALHLVGPVRMPYLGTGQADLMFKAKV